MGHLILYSVNILLTMVGIALWCLAIVGLVTGGVLGITFPSQWMFALLGIGLTDGRSRSGGSGRTKNRSTALPGKFASLVL